jgi:ABC-type nitrate/sulfonate/bicarbonate transport system substrate-binding protein
VRQHAHRTDIAGATAQMNRAYVTLLERGMWHVLIVQEGHPGYLLIDLKFWRRRTAQKIARLLNEAYEAGYLEPPP